jgi:hypothetical protein
MSEWSFLIVSRSRQIQLEHFRRKSKPNTVHAVFWQSVLIMYSIYFFILKPDSEMNPDPARRDSNQIRNQFPDPDPDSTVSVQKIVTNTPLTFPYRPDPEQNPDPRSIDNFSQTARPFTLLQQFSFRIQILDPNTTDPKIHAS